MNCIHSIPFAITTDDVIIIPEANTEPSSRLNTNYTTKFSRNIEIAFPMVPSPMIGVITIQLLIACSKLGTIGAIPRYVEIDDIKKMAKGLKRDNTRYGISIGMNNFTDISTAILEILEDDELQNPLFINFDIANGGLQQAILFTKDTLLPFCRENNLDCIVGNVATAQQAEEYFKLGVDGIRVGIGNGSACTTRLITGCGYPQLSALDEIYQMRNSNIEYSGTTIISDGGVRYPGDMNKFLCVGADCCMSGKIFSMAGESEWQVGQIPRERGGGTFYYKFYRGMSTYNDSRANEGVQIPIHLPPNVTPNSLETIIQDFMMGGSGVFTYVGASDLTELRQKYQFALISPASYSEGLPTQVQGG